METKTLAVINFVYFLSNFPKSFDDIITEVWHDDSNLAQHLIGKLHPHTETCTPGKIIKWFYDLSTTNQSKFVEWVEKNYHCSSEHRNQPWQIAINVNIDAVKDMLITALEGGSNYWYYFPDIEMVRKIGFEGLSLSEKIVRAVIEYGEEVPVYDIEDETNILGVISRENIERGLKLYLTDNMLDGGSDATEADSLFQLIVMGEVIYG
jgi:hypothetical protein